MVTPRGSCLVISASSACGQAEGKVLHQTPYPVEPSENAFQQRLGAEMDTVFLLLVWLMFFKHGAQSCGFSGLALMCLLRVRF